jgi:hypothetical protein
MSALGVELNLVLNAACYGSNALSKDLVRHITAQIDRVESIAKLSAVTTMSPLVALTVKRNFPHIDVRASVNMRLGTVKGLEYVADLFTSYNIQREFNRDIERLSELAEWAESNGKELHALVNSGCMNYCSLQSFHDNVVAHEREMDENQNVSGLTTLCRSYYGNKEHWVNFLQGSWIRPEDIEEHQLYFPGTYKLATRMHDNPRQVIHAYSTGRYYGNLLDIMEPGLGSVFFPYVIDNTRFPGEWGARTMACDKRCHACGYCVEVAKRVLVNIMRPFRKPDSEPSRSALPHAGA